MIPVTCGESSLTLGNDLHGGSGLLHLAGVLGIPGDHLGAADGAPAALAQPRVHALRVKPVLAARQHPAPVAGAERLQAYGALTAAAAFLALVARQLADLLGRKAAASSFLLRALTDAGRGV
jgi:hypothetical protein